GPKPSQGKQEDEEGIPTKLNPRRIHEGTVVLAANTQGKVTTRRRNQCQMPLRRTQVAKGSKKTKRNSYKVESKKTQYGTHNEGKTRKGK
ncbi:hypothetical protein AVEN_39262-1, partial [Araneus ventricosus]